LQSADERVCPRCGRRSLPDWLLLPVRAFQEVFGSVMPMTWVFVLICLLVFFGMYLPMWARSHGNVSVLFGDQRLSDVLRWGGIVSLQGQSGVARVTANEPWRWLSAVFVHFGPLHLGMNLLTLVALGRELEPRLGSARYGLVFLVSGALGFAASDAWSALLGHATITGGASGGLYGLIGALVGYLFARKDPRYRSILVEVAVLGLAMALLFPVNNAAHVGGFVSGFPLGVLFFKESRPWRRDLLLGAVTGALTVLAMVAIGLCSRSPYTRAAERAESAAEPFGT
jgi:membrane associated rhomboid family serine protease